jgi:hypothetical protein
MPSRPLSVFFEQDSGFENVDHRGWARLLVLIITGNRTALLVSRRSHGSEAEMRDEDIEMENEICDGEDIIFFN